VLPMGGAMVSHQQQSPDHGPSPTKDAPSDGEFMKLLDSLEVRVDLMAQMQHTRNQIQARTRVKDEPDGQGTHVMTTPPGDPRPLIGCAPSGLTSAALAQAQQRLEACEAPPRGEGARDGASVELRERLHEERDRADALRRELNDLRMRAHDTDSLRDRLSQSLERERDANAQVEKLRQQLHEARMDAEASRKEWALEREQMAREIQSLRSEQGKGPSSRADTATLPTEPVLIPPTMRLAEELAAQEKQPPTTAPFNRQACGVNVVLSEDRLSRGDHIRCPALWQAVHQAWLLIARCHITSIRVWAPQELELELELEKAVEEEGEEERSARPAAPRADRQLSEAAVHGARPCDGSRWHSAAMCPAAPGRIPPPLGARQRSDSHGRGVSSASNWKRKYLTDNLHYDVRALLGNRYYLKAVFNDEGQLDGRDYIVGDVKYYAGIAQNRKWRATWVTSATFATKMPGLSLRLLVCTATEAGALPGLQYLTSYIDVAIDECQCTSFHEDDLNRVSFVIIPGGGHQVQRHGQPPLHPLLKNVQLIKLEYFIYLHTPELQMPKCQDVPMQWVLDVDVELDSGSLEIISRCIAGIISSERKVLLIDEHGRSDLETAGQDKIFTEGFDKDKVGILRYRDTLRTITGDANDLQMQNLGFGGPQEKEVVKLVRARGRVRSPDLSSNSISVPFEDWNIKVVQPLVRLTVLKFCKTQVTGDTNAVEPLVNLTWLSLSDTQAKGDIRAAQPFVNLTVLKLSKTQVAGDTTPVEPYAKLTMLDLAAMQVTGDTWAVVERIAKLSTVNFWHMQATGDIKVINDIWDRRTFVNLTELWLKGARVSGDIQHMQPLVKLTELVLNDTQLPGDAQVFDSAPQGYDYDDFSLMPGQVSFEAAEVDLAGSQGKQAVPDKPVVPEDVKLVFQFASTSSPRLDAQGRHERCRVAALAKLRAEAAAFVLGAERWEALAEKPLVEFVEGLACTCGTTALKEVGEAESPPLDVPCHGEQLAADDESTVQHMHSHTRTTRMSRFEPQPFKRKLAMISLGPAESVSQEMEPPSCNKQWRQR
ncbi:unnamed protein product, partial [Prorocentrum cordatum]